MNFIVEKKSPYDLKTTIERFKALLPSQGFGVLWELNFKDKLSEKGFELQDNFWVFEVCNPSKADKVLNEWIKTGYFLPCKMAAYEQDGEVFIGLPRPVELIALLTPDDLLRSYAEEVEMALTDIIDKVVSEEEVNI
ncbi:DUF302 domain-containing protein [Fusibacter paucivorans]|uniref:DUF302 domain-containing protein n=1 Tax=Fusibacter paucivorans TaxID=76009 RepID=A0ABS5PM97_9FIRM|nr:DUF302 domain-containing protein [Fusibacter paucivorans]MBS7525982.1 DUF302 domain-containing protein [Fusibacter paucivorans]